MARKRKGRAAVRHEKQPLRGEMSVLRAIGIAPKVPKQGAQMKATGKLHKKSAGPASKVKNRPLLGLV